MTPEAAKINPRALELAEFATEVMDLLQTNPTPPGRICAEAGTFEERYGFARKPGYVRFRSGSLSFPGPWAWSLVQ